MARMRPLAFKPGLGARQFAEAPRKRTGHIPLRADRHRTSPAKRRNRGVAVLARATKEQQVGHCEALSTVTDELSSARAYERLMKAEFNLSSLAAAVATMARFAGRISPTESRNPHGEEAPLRRLRTMRSLSSGAHSRDPLASPGEP
jgi:hypothetical protein